MILFCIFQWKLEGQSLQTGDGQCDDENKICGCEWDLACCGSSCSGCKCLEPSGDDKDFLIIHNGGSNDSDTIVRKLTGTMNQTEISIAGNQMFVVFRTNEEIGRKGFHALIMESKYFAQCSFNQLGPAWASLGQLGPAWLSLAHF